MSNIQKINFLESKVAEPQKIPIRILLEIRNKIQLARIAYERDTVEFYILLGFIHGTLLGLGKITFEEHEMLSN